jgi:hypothetical protein
VFNVGDFISVKIQYNHLQIGKRYPPRPEGFDYPRIYLIVEINTSGFITFCIAHPLTFEIYEDALYSSDFFEPLEALWPLK